MFSMQTMPKRMRQLVCLSFVLALTSCADVKKQSLKLFSSSADAEPEDAYAKQTLQGIWIDSETDNISFFANGDSLFYPDTAFSPVRFFFRNDTLFLASADTSTYPVKELKDNSFIISSATKDTIQFVRSLNPDDTLFFLHHQATPLTYQEVTKTDSVIYHAGARYHCYVYVNPSSLKVYKTSYTDEGLAVKNVYFDNVIHICVYQGKTCLFARDYNKNSFEGLVPDSFLAHAILLNIEINAADAEGCHFFASLSIPDDVSCYMIDILAGYDGNETLRLADNN